MKDQIAEIFGYAVLAIAAALAIWELRASKQVDQEVQWLYTPARTKRRLFMAAILVCVGCLIILEARDFLVLERISHMVVYVICLTIFAFALFILSIRDLGDMARNAERQAVKDLQSALDARKASEEDSESRPE